MSFFLPSTFEKYAIILFAKILKIRIVELFTVSCTLFNQTSEIALE